MMETKVRESYKFGYLAGLKQAKEIIREEYEEVKNMPTDAYYKFMMKIQLMIEDLNIKEKGDA